MEYLQQGRREIWRQRLARFAKSGLTVSRFCQKEGVSPPSFYLWRRKLGEASARSEHTGRIPAFQPLSVTLGGALVRIRFAGGTRVEIPADRPELACVLVAEVALLEQGRRRESQPC